LELTNQCRLKTGTTLRGRYGCLQTGLALADLAVVRLRGIRVLVEDAGEETRAVGLRQGTGQGVASRQLPPKETIRLERRQARVDRHIDKAEADGKVTKKEATVINREQNRESRRIRRQKHDGQAR